MESSKPCDDLIDWDANSEVLSALDELQNFLFHSDLSVPSIGNRYNASFIFMQKKIYLIYLYKTIGFMFISSKIHIAYFVVVQIQY